jgi:orotate phosphoribosyltransferase
VRGEVRHYVFSKVMSWVALDRGIRMAEELSLEGDTAAWRAARDALHAEIMERGWRPQAIGGMTMGADPIVVGVAMLSAQQIHGRANDKPGDRPSRWYIDGFLVRKAEKTHGTAKRIEGFHQKGARVVIVDDVCTTGASTIQAIEAAREAGETRTARIADAKRVRVLRLRCMV